MSDASADRETRRSAAVAAVRSAVATLRRLDVEAKVIGSLASSAFGSSSDIDLLVVSCPRERKYAIESLIEDELEGLPFDVIYLDEVPAWKRDRLMHQAVDASDLR